MIGSFLCKIKSGLDIIENELSYSQAARKYDMY